MVNAVPTAGTYPLHFNKREAKVIETCLSASGTLTAKTITSSTLGTTNTFTMHDTLTTIVDGAAPTKVLGFDCSGMTAGKTVTIAPVSDVNSILKLNFTGSTTGKYLSLACAISADRVATFPDKSGTVAMTSDIGADVRATATVALTAAEIADIYGTPKQIIAAPAAGQAIIVEHVEVLHTYAVAQYTGGGVCKLQYKNTNHGGGVVLGPDLDSIVKAASTSNSMWSVTNTAVDMADITAQGVFLSNATGVYADGNAGNVLKIRVSYRVVTVVA